MGVVMRMPEFFLDPPLKSRVVDPVLLLLLVLL